MAIGVIYFELNNNYGNHNFEFGFRINATGVWCTIGSLRWSINPSLGVVSETEGENLIFIHFSINYEIKLIYFEIGIEIGIDFVHRSELWGSFIWRESWQVRFYKIFSGMSMWDWILSAVLKGILRCVSQ